MREALIEALKSHATGHIDKHKANVEVLLQKVNGIAEHPDVIETIEKELKIYTPKGRGNSMPGPEAHEREEKG